MRWPTGIAILGLALTSSRLVAGTIDPQVLSQTQIAVEKLTGRGEDYGVSFSGWVGSLRFSLQDKRIYISAISSEGVVTEVHALGKVKDHGDSIEFEATDMTPPVEGAFVYRGKIWMRDDGTLHLEMIRTDSPRRWVNLGPHGRKFLTDSGLGRLHLGL